MSSENLKLAWRQSKSLRQYHLETRTAWQAAMRNTANPANIDRYIEALTTQLDAMSAHIDDIPTGNSKISPSMGSEPVSLFSRADFVCG
jgi:hypothetical protein